MPAAADVFVVVGAPASWRQALWIGFLRSPRGSAVSHRSAARLHGIGRFPEGPIDIAEPGRPHHLERPASPHSTTSLPAAHLTTIDGLVVTNLARTVFDLAGLVSRKRWLRGWPSLTEGAVERALDDAFNAGLRHDDAIAMLDALGGRGRGGTVLFRRMLDDRGEGYVATETELEDLVVAVLDRYGAPAPVRQRTVGNTEAPVGRVDFVYPLPRVVVEADGRKHHSELLDRERDLWRDLELAASGYVVVRVTHRQLTRAPKRFVDGLVALIDRRTALFPPP